MEAVALRADQPPGCRRQHVLHQRLRKLRQCLAVCQQLTGIEVNPAVLLRGERRVRGDFQRRHRTRERRAAPRGEQHNLCARRSQRRRRYKIVAGGGQQIQAGRVDALAIRQHVAHGGETALLRAAQRLVFQCGNAARLVAGGWILVNRLVMLLKIALEVVNQPHRLVEQFARVAAIHQDGFRAEHFRHFGQNRRAAQAALASAKQELEKNQEKLSKDQEALNLANSDQADKAAALSKAQETLSAAQAAQAVARDRLAQEEKALAQANQALEQARTKRDAAQAAVAQAQTALDQAQKNLANLQDAQTNLEQAQANLAAAEKDLADKTSDLAAKQQTLSELKAAQAQAEKVYNSLAAQLQAQEKQKRDDHYRNILDQTEKRLNGPVQSNPSEGMQTQESGSDPLVKTKEEPIVKGVATRKAPANRVASTSSDPGENHSMQASVGSSKLPNTGSRLSVWAMMSGILALVSGFTLLVWKHKKESKN